MTARCATELDIRVTKNCKPENKNNIEMKIKYTINLHFNTVEHFLSEYLKGLVVWFSESLVFETYF